MKTLTSVVLNNLEQFEFVVGIHEYYAVCEFDPDSCDKLKGCVQELMNQGLIPFSRAKAVEEIVVIEPITIMYRKKKVEAPPKRIHLIHFRVPSLFPYQNTKEVPWKYGTTTYVGGKEIHIPDSEIVNITRTGDMTRSVLVLSPKHTPRVSSSPTIIPRKEKVIPPPPL